MREWNKIVDEEVPLGMMDGAAFAARLPGKSETCFNKFVSGMVLHMANGTRLVLTRSRGPAYECIEGIPYHET